MGLFDRIKKSSTPLAAAVIAVPAVLDGESGGITAKTAKTSTATLSAEPKNEVVDDPVTRHSDSCPDCGTQPNCPARGDCLELVRAGYRADPHDAMTCSCLRCLNERGERPGTDPSLSPKPNSGEPASIRSQIERLLADGPKPYESILEAVGGDEDAIREAIRNWPGLTAYDSCGVWTWELSRDPVSIAERVALKFEAETPSDLGKPVLTYRGHVLAWESDPPHIKIYSWATVHLFPGRPLTVDVEPVARLLELSPREVRDALARLVKDGDLVRSWEGGREWYRLNIRYPEVRSDVPS